MFQTTHWTTVLAAKKGDTQGRAALSELCVRYCGPIRSFIERTVASDDPRRYGRRDAEDLAHDFIAELLGGKMIEYLEPRGGKFRSYLLGAVKHFLADLRKRENAAKRGGEVKHVPIEMEIPIFDSLSDARFDRDWARSIIDQAIEKLGNAPETKAFIPWFSKELSAIDRVRLSEKLGMSDTAVKVALHRLRKKFRRIVKESIAETVESESEIDSELAYLIEALNS